MTASFFLSVGLAGLACGVLGYIGFEKIFSKAMADAPPSKKILYILILLWVFAFGVSITVIGVFFDIESWGWILMGLWAGVVVISIPGLMLAFALYMSFHMGEGYRVENLIKEAATPIVGLVVGIILGFAFTPEECVKPMAEWQPEDYFCQEFKLLTRIPIMIVGGFMSAGISWVTKFILSLWAK